MADSDPDTLNVGGDAGPALPPSKPRWPLYLMAAAVVVLGWVLGMWLRPANPSTRTQPVEVDHG